LVERYLAIEQIIEIETVHTDDALASAKGDEAVIGEAAVAHEQASRPGGLLFNLAVERVQIGDANWLTMPFGFQQIGLAAELEAAVDLLTAKAERFLGGQTECVEQALEESLEGKAACLCAERGDPQQLGFYGGDLLTIDNGLELGWPVRRVFGIVNIDLQPSPEPRTTNEVNEVIYKAQRWIV
jgi:hypothetical protein